MRDVTTGCRDETAARQVLAELERRADKVRSGLRTAAEDSAVDHMAAAIETHFVAYTGRQQAKGLNRTRISNSKSRLRRFAADCGFGRLADLNAAALERWLADRGAEDMSAGTRNEYRQEAIGFANWCVRSG